MARAIAYLRASTSKQDTSTGAQLETLRSWCEERGHELVAHFADEATSGSTDPLDRDGFTAAVDALEDGDLLLVTERSRVSRDGVAAAGLEYLLQRERGAELVALDCADEDADPMLAMVRRFVADLTALQERLKVKTRTRAALRARRVTGRAWNHAPFGYRVEEIDGDKRLVPDEREQEILELVRELREDGMSLRAVASELNERGHRTRKGGEWSHRLVRNAMQDKRAA